MNANPVLTAFAAAIPTEMVFGQIWIRRDGTRFELRHCEDRDRDPSSLRLLGEKEIRPLAQFTACGAFRPLKSAPNLPHGWRAAPRDVEALGLALNQLYPGAVADWFAAKSPQPPVTSYREFTERQTGMYRVTTFLTDSVAGAAIRACCHTDFCLKQRLWTVHGLAPDSPGQKSPIPCLEPCAIMLEFARRVARLEQAEETNPPDIPAQRAEAEAAARNPDLSIAECDFESPNNPRRVRFLLEKYPAGGTSQVG
jgi:hypothetical protein